MLRALPLPAGTLPNLSNFGKLVRIDLGENFLKQVMPRVGALPPNIQSLVADHNDLKGECALRGGLPFPWSLQVPTFVGLQCTEPCCRPRPTAALYQSSTATCTRLAAS